MKTRLWIPRLVFAAALSIAITGVGGGRFSRAQALEDDPSYFASFLDSVWFIQWTESNGSLTGQFQQIYVAGDKPPTVSSMNTSFVGIHSGPDISLKLGDFLTSTVWTGTLRGPTLRLAIPNGSGLLTTIVLRAGSVEDYNKAASEFRQRIEWQATLARRRGEVFKADAAIRNVYNDLRDALNRLAADDEFGDVLRGYRARLAKMQKDRDKLHTDATAEFLSCYRLSVVKYDLSVLRYDLSTVQYQRTVFDFRRDRVLDDIAWVQQDIRRLEGNVQTLHVAVAADSTKAIPSNSSYLSAITRVTSEIIAFSREYIQIASDHLNKAQAQADGFGQEGARYLEDEQLFVDGLRCAQ